MKDIDYLKRAEIIAEALPYVRKYHGKTIVVKYGGAAIEADSQEHPIISDIVLLALMGISVVVVHGGGPEINHMLAKVGKEPHFVNGLRHTDEETMDIVQMVLCGKVNKQIVQLIGEQGGRAIGLSGLDGQMLKANALDPELGLVGKICSIDPTPIRLALEGGYIPVVSTVACAKQGGYAYNVNADTAAASLAAAIGAEKLVLMTDVRGLMHDPQDEKSLISVVNLAEIALFIKNGIISGGMIPKIECCVQAVRQGVPRAHILDGRIPHSLLIELLSDHGIGTMIVQ